jgi:hypothetical protein
MGRGGVGEARKGETKEKKAQKRNNKTEKNREWRVDGK